MKSSTLCRLTLGVTCLFGGALTGCQTYQVGQTLPSGYHMFDDVEYIPKGPDFPLSNELNAMQSAELDRQRAKAGRQKF